MDMLRPWWRVALVLVLVCLVIVALVLYPPSRRYLRSLVVSDYVYSSVRITYPEGVTTREMARETVATFPHVSQNDFIKMASPYEGYLFPDTYLFPASVTATSVVATLRTTFTSRTAALQHSTSTTHAWSDIVTMASLVEKEARTSESRHVVAGILWNRIAHGMPLQVDAVFGYIFGRDTYSPSAADLKVDSQYNTYTHTGLPPGPIDNPGLDSLDAAANPAQTNYLYYLTGSDNLMHYATTYAGHQTNRKKYLR